MASNLSDITAFDVYNRMIELNFPEEMATLFQSEMKDGYLNFILDDGNSIIRSNNVSLISALVKLVASFANRSDSSFKNMPMKLMCEPWPESMCDVLAAEVDHSRVERIKEAISSAEFSSNEQPSSLPQTTKNPKPMALKELTNLPARTSSSSSSITKATTSDDTTTYRLPTAQIYEPSDIKIFVCNVIVNLPRFSVNVEQSLSLEDECFQMLPKACLEIAEFLWQSNLNVRTTGDYRQIATAILLKHEVLNGIINRYILKGLLNSIPNPPKSSVEHVSKLLQTTFSNLRNQRKKEAKKYKPLLNQYKPQSNF